MNFWLFQSIKVIETLEGTVDEIQTGYDIIGSGTTSPDITSDTLFFDDLEQELI